MPPRTRLHAMSIPLLLSVLRSHLSIGFFGERPIRIGVFLRVYDLEQGGMDFVTMAASALSLASTSTNRPVTSESGGYGSGPSRSGPHPVERSWQHGLLLAGVVLVCCVDTCAVHPPGHCIIGGHALPHLDSK